MEIFTIAAASVTYQQIKSFGPNLDLPKAGLIEGNDGALYGTASGGEGEEGGTVFKINKNGTGYAVLHSFSNTGGDGYYPTASLTEGTDGVLYGTTAGGGSAGAGTVFKMNKDGTDYAVLRSFSSTAGDGQYPLASLTEGNDGVFYGTTSEGGSAQRGTVFKISKDGTVYAILRSFGSVVGDGWIPAASLTEGNDGVLYGTTQGGGSGETGTIFKMNKNGTGYTILHSFSNTSLDGQYPLASLTEGNDGVLYGTTSQGGSAGVGTIFKMNKDGMGYTVLRSFSTVGGDGQRPYASLTEGNDGVRVLYGTTSQGGSVDKGTVFKVNKDGTGYTVLRSFISTGGDGQYPYASLTKGSDGLLYGTTTYGGHLHNGTIFRINLNQPPLNQPPTAPVQTFMRTPGLSLKIKKADVLAACSDPEGAAVTLQSLGSSAQGATITQTATHIFYTPVNGNNDQFTYTVSDAQGATATGTIQVQVVSPGGIVQSITSSGGTLMVNFAGIPGFNYGIQRATSPSGPWSTLVTQPAPANGLFSYTDPSPPSPSAFYRLIQP